MEAQAKLIERVGPCDNELTATDIESLCSFLEGKDECAYLEPPTAAGACHIQVSDRRVFDFPAPACIPFVVLCCGALTAEFGRRYRGLHRKLSSSLPWVVFCVSSVGLVQCSRWACPPHRKLWIVLTDDQPLRLGQVLVQFVGIGCLH